MREIVSLSVFAAVVLFAPAIAAQQKPLPPNTIDCKDYTPLPNGFWYAHKDAKPFDIGNLKHMRIDDVTFFPHSIKVGDYDFSDILEQRCHTR